MKKAMLCCFDGPKGSGKSTLLDEVWRMLAADGRVSAMKLTEKALDPFRVETLELIRALGECPDQRLERRVCEQLAAGRAWISENVLDGMTPNNVALIDRWYPSDAAFRHLPFGEVLQINLAAGVRVPDLVVGVTCAPEISWRRAAQRERGLSSLVIKSFQNHIASTRAFDAAVEMQGWMACCNEGPIADAALSVVARIYAAISCNAITVLPR